jgi:pimeloyl-ACP methyl ester carboxylesterase
MPHARVDGARLWYEVRGKGPPLVLIGGYALVDRQFEFCDEHLAKHFTLVHWHYRGVGRSDWTMTAPYTLERWVDDLAGVLDAAGIERAAIWCTSTGSAIGTRFASKYPERTTALVTYPWVRADQGWRDIFEAAYHVARVFGVRQLSRLYAGAVLPPDLLYSPAGISYEKWAKGRYAENLNPTTLKEVHDAYSVVDLTGDVRNLECPTLLLLGNESALNRKADRLESAAYDTLVREFTALKRDVQIATIRGAGSTYCMITKPKECSQAVIKFLKRVLKPAR